MNVEPTTNVSNRRSAPRIVTLMRGAVAGGLLVSGLSMCNRHKAVVHQVVIKNFEYLPAGITIALGDTVVWRNSDIVPHTVTARDSSWDSGSIAVDSVWRFVARSAGTNSYFCVFHPNMKGTLTVR